MIIGSKPVFTNVVYTNMSTNVTVLIFCNFIFCAHYLPTLKMWRFVMFSLIVRSWWDRHAHAADTHINKQAVIKIKVAIRFLLKNIQNAEILIHLIIT